MSLLSVQNLGVSFPVGQGWRRQRLRALHNVSFALERGEILGVVGESGSGKSTLGRVLARLVQPERGQLHLDGQDILSTEPHRASRAYRRRVQLVFQDPFSSLNPVHSVMHHIARPLLLHNKADRHTVRAKVLSLLEQVGLQPADAFIDKPPFALSGGQRQRVAIARAIAPEPDLLIADEPTSMLDQSIRMEVLRLIDALRRERNLAVIFITHDLASARWLCDRILVLYAGQAMEIAPSRDLTQSPHHPYAQLLIAAAPRPGGSLDQNLPAADGVPQTIDPPPGCPFAPRCPRAFDTCATDPIAVQVNSNHEVYCHLHRTS